MCRGFTTGVSMKDKCVMDKYLKLIKLGLIIGLIIGLTSLHLYLKDRAVTQAKTELVTQYEKKLLDAVIQSKQAETDLQEKARQHDNAKEAHIRALDSKLNNALSELRKRPKRPANSSKDTGDKQACTARELYREDAEFLTRESARAESVLVERDYYYNQYESVRRRLDEIAD